MVEHLLLVGAGLHAGILARRLLTLADPPRITMLEGSETPFGDHTWSFHGTDVRTEDMNWIGPLIRHRWSRQSVRFPAFSRTLDAPYYSITSDSMTAVLGKSDGLDIRAGTRVASLTPTEARLTDGTRIEADCVVDARGFAGHPALVLGHRVLVGLELETEHEHGVGDPVIMDATLRDRDRPIAGHLLLHGVDRPVVAPDGPTEGARMKDGRPGRVWDER